MHSVFASLSFMTVLTAAAVAQCGNFAAPGTFLVNGDDSVAAAHIPLGFAFPMAGSAGTASWTHFRASTNGWIVLTDGTNSIGIMSGTSYGSVVANSASSLYGAVGSNPRIAPYWGDLNSSGTNGVYYDNTTAAGISTRITWVNVVDFGNAVQKSFQIELFATGVIRFHYGPGMTNNAGGSKYVGVSAANGTAVQTAVDLVPGPAATAGSAMHQVFGALGSLDTGGRTLEFTPSGLGWNEAVTCAVLSASHTSFGTGCYNFSDSMYQLFATSAAASPALANTAITFTGLGSVYTATNAGALLPVGSVQAVPTIVANGDDVTQVVPFTVGSFPGSSGLAICSNGFVSLAAGNGSGFSPSIATLLGDPQTSFRCWHDFNPTIAGSGQIKYEESAAVTMITWDGVWDFGGTSAADASTLQMQFYPSGTVVIAWGAVSPVGASGTGVLLGFSPGGPSVNAGGIDFATGLPSITSAVNIPAMTLAASPAPVSTPGSGTLVTYAQANIPEAVPASGVFFGATVLSVGSYPSGRSLAIIGMPGCLQYVASIDVMLAFVGASASQTTQFQIPAGVPYGFQLFAQSVAMVAPGIFNPFGATVSNGVASFISGF